MGLGIFTCPPMPTGASMENAIPADVRAVNTPSLSNTIPLRFSPEQKKGYPDLKVSHDPELNCFYAHKREHSSLNPKAVCADRNLDN